MRTQLHTTNLWLRAAWALFIVVVFLPAIWFFARTLGAEIIGLGGTVTALYIPNDRPARLLLRSIGLGVGATAVALALGTLTGYLTTRFRFFGRRVLFALLGLPFLLPSYCYGIAWIEFFAPGTAMITREPAISPIYSIWATMLLLGVYLFPWVHVVAAAGFASIERHIEEAGRFALSRPTRFARITLPLMAGVLASAGLFVFVLGLKNDSIPSLLRQHVFAREIMIAYQIFLDERQAALKGLAGLLISFLALVAALWISRRRRRIAIEGLSSPLDESAPTDRGGWIAALIGIAVFGFTFVLPIGILIRASGGWTVLAMVFESGWPQIGNGLVTAAATATVTIVLGFLLAEFLNHSGQGIAGLTIVAVFVLFALPAPVLDIGLIRMWNRPPAAMPVIGALYDAMAAVYDSRAMLVLGQTAYFLPITVLGFSVALRRINPRLLEAADLAGLPWRTVAGRLLFPMLQLWIVGLWAVVFVLALNDVEAAVLLAPPGGDTLSVRIMTLLHTASDTHVAAMCLIQIVLAATAIAIVATIVGIMGRRKK